MAAKPLTQEELTELRELEELERLEKLEAAGKLVSKPNYSQAKTAKEHLVEGLALGHGDTIAGGINKLLDKGMRATNELGLTGPSPYQVDEQLKADGATGDLSESAYQEGVDDRRKLLKDTADANPKTAMAADFAGGLATSGLVAAATGGGSLAAEGAVVGTGYGNSDTLQGNIMNAAGGALLGEYGGKVLGAVNKKIAPNVGAAIGKYGGNVLGAAGKGLKKAAKSIKPDMVKNIYGAIARRSGAKQPEKVMEAIKRLEDKYSVFTNSKGISITAEGVEDGVKSIYDNAQNKLNEITQQISKNVRPQELVEEFKPIVGRLTKMYDDVVSNTTNKELSNKLMQSKALLNDALTSGDYQRVVNIVNQELKDRYVSYNSLGEAQVSKPIRSEMKQLLSDFDQINKGLIGDVGGEGVAKEFSGAMSDLRDYYKVNDLVSRNSSTLSKGAQARVDDFVVGGAVGTIFSNPILTAAYIKGASQLRSPVVQGALAKSYKAIPRSFEPVKDFITNSPISGIILENVPEEVNHLVKKVQAGVNIPTAQQHLIVKSMTSMFPEFFEYSEYESLVDGKITDPYEVKVEKQKIMKDSSISNVEKFKRTNALNKDGTLLRNASTAKGTVQPVSDQQQQQISNFVNVAEGIVNGNIPEDM